MAKKRKPDEEEEFGFPDFDEAAYLRKEVELAKASFVSIALAIALAVVLWAITLDGLAIVAFFLGLLVTFGLRWIFLHLPWPKIDLAKFERNNWLGQGATFLFTWLAVWILLLNVPFADVTPPVITGVTVNGIAAPDGGSVSGLTANKNVTINATILENGVLTDVNVSLYGVGHTLPPGGAFYTLTVRFTGNTTVTITAKDGGGHTVTYSFSIGL